MTNMANLIVYCWLLIGQLLLSCYGDIGSSHLIRQHSALTDDLIRYVNNINTTWKAGVKFADQDYSFLKFLQYTRPTSHKTPANQQLRLKPQTRVNPQKIPESFNAMEAWPHCYSIKKIYDQGPCDAGWAFAALSAMSDRYCIFSKTKSYNITLSAENLISCCRASCGFGCFGGYSSAAWHYWVQTGVVTGGGFKSSQGCQPYIFRPCLHNHTKVASSKMEDEGHALPTCAPDVATPDCKKECQKGYNSSYQQDLHFGKSAYAVHEDATLIGEEIMSFGPVEASMDVYEDFCIYTSGIYKHVVGDFIMKHSVKLYGWGVTPDGVNYWMASNSWNDQWGDKGFFKILRGKNECGIEKEVHAGLPK